MRPVEHPSERERGSAASRVLLSVAVALTVGAVGVGTWVLGSGDDPVDQERATTSVSDITAPGRAQPALPVAPLPDADPADTTG
jgi:hypothetical protein